MNDQETNTCGSCIYGTGEGCDGPSGSREGHEIFSDTLACDYYLEDDSDTHNV